MKPSWSLIAQRFPPENLSTWAKHHTHALIELHIKPKRRPCDFSYNSSFESKDNLGLTLLIWNRENDDLMKNMQS